jgi:hypothetical protein
VIDDLAHGNTALLVIDICCETMAEQPARR